MTMASTVRALPQTPKPLHAVAGFAAHLREHGYKVGIAEQQAMLDAALQLPLDATREVEACWRAIVCADRDTWRRYPELFELYWFPQRTRGSVRSSGATRRSRNLPELMQDMHRDMDAQTTRPDAKQTQPSTLSDQGASEIDAHNEHAQGGAARSEPLHSRAFGEWLQTDLQRLNRLAEDVATRVRKRLTRRKQIATSARLIDLRRTLRDNLRYGGVLLKPARRRVREEPARIFILVDVSRSMELYAQLFLRVARAFCTATRARAFVFHTRLVEVTELLKKRSGRVQEKINAVTFGFGGGTRIATSLHDFLATHGRALSRRSLVLVFSDGYDTDVPHALRGELARINARGARVYWLHPSAATHFSTALEQARDVVRGFVPAHNLESLERLPQSIH